MELARQWRALRRAQDAQLERIDVSPTKAALLRGERRRSRRALVVAAAAILIAAATFVLRPRSLVFWIDGVEGRPGAWMAAPADAPLVLSFSEGTRFELAPEARARVSDIDARGARLVIERGDVKVSVVHRHEGRWSLQLGPYEVFVMGTKFAAGWRPESETLSVELFEGKVRVAGPHLAEGFSLTPGQRLEVERPRGIVSVRAQGEPEPPRAALPSTPEEEAPAPAPPAPPPKATADWKQLAREGRYADAMQQARKLGFEPLCEALDAEALALLADSARFAGDTRGAAHALHTMRRRFAGDRAARAAFLLGRLAFERDPAAAARWFATYLAEAPAGALVREAAGRLIEAHVAAGDETAAQKAARDYLARHPDGPHAALARRVLQ